MVKAAWELAQTDDARKAELLETAFRGAQRSQLLAAAAALGQTALRQATGNSKLSELMRERERLTAERNGLDQRMRQSVLQVAGRQDAGKVLDDHVRIRDVDTLIAAIDKALAQDFPAYAALDKPQPLGIADIQAHLRDDEAMVLLTTTPRLGGFDTPGLPLEIPEWMKRGDFPEETFVWVVTKRDARWAKAGLDDRNLSQEIFTLRCGLDNGNWDGETPVRRRCEALVRVPRPVGGHPPFHIYQAYSLYRALFGQMEDMIQGKHLLIAPTGPFTALPFQVLVAKEPGVNVPIKAAPTSAASYKDIAWLGMLHPITVLPSVASFKVLRERSAAARAHKPFIGFGNPTLAGSPGLASHRDRATLGAQGTACRSLAAAGGMRLPLEYARAPAGLLRGRQANVALLRQQTPLPETAEELCTIAERLGARDDDVLLGSRMTETEIKALSRKGALRDYRVLHFATHGLVAGETATLLSGAAEPALLFTPPDKATDTDDGLLTASEVTQLELNADWVIMSACRTAAGENQDAEALSGLARAFFYAGARALLVSHWAVESEAAVSITTGAFEAMASDPAIEEAEALRRSLVALQAKGGPNMHPTSWAAFSLVGGGEAR